MLRVVGRVRRGRWPAPDGERGCGGGGSMPPPPVGGFLDHGGLNGRLGLLPGHLLLELGRLLLQLADLLLVVAVPGWGVLFVVGPAQVGRPRAGQHVSGDRVDDGGGPALGALRGARAVVAAGLPPDDQPPVIGWAHRVGVEDGPVGELDAVNGRGVLKVLGERAPVGLAVSDLDRAPVAATRVVVAGLPPHGDGAAQLHDAVEGGTLLPVQGDGGVHPVAAFGDQGDVLRARRPGAAHAATLVSTGASVFSKRGTAPAASSSTVGRLPQQRAACR